MAEIKVTELPSVVLEDFTDNDSFLLIDDGKLRRLTKATFNQWVEENIKGEKGEQGVAGRDGARGSNGRDGVNGKDGMSAYQIAVSNGFTGTVTQWQESLKGVDGAASARGDDGWSPVFESEVVGIGAYLKVVDWVGGTGDKPTTLGYVSPLGIVQDVNIASNVRGAKGDRGVQGEKGSTGARGVQGEKGVQGLRGLSAYDVAVSEGYTGTETEWLLTLNPATISKKTGNILRKEIDGLYAEAPAYTPESMATAIDALPDKNFVTDSQITKIDNFNKLTKEEIKTLYESNTNTNAFTDSHKLKLENMSDGGGGTTTPIEYGTAYLNYYQSNKSSETIQGVGTLPALPENPSTGGSIGSHEAIFDQYIASDVGSFTVILRDCLDKDWKVYRNGVLISAWDMTHTDVEKQATSLDGNTLYQTPTPEQYKNVNLTIKLNDESLVNEYKIVSSARDFQYLVTAFINGDSVVAEGIVRTVFKKLPNSKHIQFAAYDTMLFVPATLPASVNSLENTFNACSLFNDPNVLKWDVSRVTNFKGTFNAAIKFNQPIGIWNMKSARSLSRMFYNADSFNSPVGAWNTRYVSEMESFMDAVLESRKPPSQNLTQWCTPFLAHYADNEALRDSTGIDPADQPVWGTCPRGEIDVWN